MDSEQLLRGDYGSEPDAIEPRIQQIVEQVFLDEDGLLVGAINGETLNRYTEADMAGVDVRETIGDDLGAPHRYRLILMNYEETGMAHGDWLMAMLARHRATGDSISATHAREAFAAIQRLADTVARDNPYGRGWWPKPYGGMNDLDEMFETSIDQTIKIVLAIRQYADSSLASPAEQRWCTMQIRAMADWWVQHHYTTRYFGNCCWWDLLPGPHASSALLLLVREAMAACGDRHPTHLVDAWEYLLTHRDWTMRTRGGTNSHNLGIECQRRLDEIAPEHQGLWRRGRDILIAHTVGRLDEVGTDVVPEYGCYNTGLRAACSAAVVCEWTGSDEWLPAARRLLRLYHSGDRFYHHYQDCEQPPSRVACWHAAISGHHYVAWLLAYWRLRAGGKDA